jgi:hypothetical protein
MLINIFRKESVLEFTFSKAAFPAALSAAGNVSLGPGQLELVPADEDGAVDGVRPDPAAFGLATMITRASRLPELTGPATRTCWPLARSDRLTF